MSKLSLKQAFFFFSARMKKKIQKGLDKNVKMEHYE